MGLNWMLSVVKKFFKKYYFVKVGHLHCAALVPVEEMPALDTVGCEKSSNLLSPSHLPATVPEASPSFNKHFVVIVVD